MWRTLKIEIKIFLLSIKTGKLLKAYNNIWDKVSSLMKKKVDSKPVYSDDDRYIKTKTKSSRGTIYTNFHGKIPKENEC